MSNNLFLEVLLLRLRGETIKYASAQKRQNLSKEILLVKQIEELETTTDTDSDVELEIKKKRIRKAQRK